MTSGLKIRGGWQVPSRGPPCYDITWNVNQTCHYESNHCYPCWVCSAWAGRETSGREEVDGLEIGGQHGHGRRFVLLRHTHRPQKRPYPICTRHVVRRPCCSPMSNPATSSWTARPDCSGRWDNRMAAQHLPRDLVRPSSGYEKLAQRRRLENHLRHNMHV